MNRYTMERELTRYRLEDNEVEEIIVYLREKNLSVDRMESNMYFIYRYFPGNEIRGCGKIFLRDRSVQKTDQKNPSNYIEVIYGGDDLLPIVEDYYQDQKKVKLEKLISQK